MTSTERVRLKSNIAPVSHPQAETRDTETPEKEIAIGISLGVKSASEGTVEQSSAITAIHAEPDPGLVKSPNRSLTDAQKARRRESAIKRWQSPGFRERASKAISDGLKQKWKNPEYRKKSSRASRKRMIKKWKDPDYKQRLSESHRQGWKNPAYREKRRVNDPDLLIWEEARTTGLIEKIVASGLLSQEEISLIDRYFQTRRTHNIHQKVKDLLERFSLAVANLA